MTISEFILWAISGVVVVLITSTGWFITNTLSKIDKNQEQISAVLTKHSEEIARLQVSHEMLWKQLERGD